MHLYELPLLFALIGLALYAVLGGADFGAGFWQLPAGRGPRRAHARARPRLDGAVWEANHVWLIFVLSGLDRLSGRVRLDRVDALVPLFIAAVGIILRGAAYALRAGATAAREARAIDRCPVSPRC